ncbi:MAG: hypothetical protein HQ591_12995 [candidate division Zixibacteria bacterium]|nr:hypothetical protein [Candidatus Tariuqbacter arcticus]
MYKKDWTNKRISFSKLKLHIYEMQKTVNLLRQENVDILYKCFEEEFSYMISPPSKTLELTKRIIQESQEKGEFVIKHGELQELLVHIGKLNGLISQKEYRMGNERLDVVWRKIEEGAPTYVFEIQLGGDMYHALGKLKHAYDLWNSNIFIITTNESLNLLYNLLSGTFHEIRDKIKKISPEKIAELYVKKSSWIELEREIGLIN